MLNNPRLPCQINECIWGFRPKFVIIIIFTISRTKIAYRKLIRNSTGLKEQQMRDYYALRWIEKNGEIERDNNNRLERWSPEDDDGVGRDEFLCLCESHRDLLFRWWFAAQYPSHSIYMLCFLEKYWLTVLIYLRPYAYNDLRPSSSVKIFLAVSTKPKATI